MEKLIKRLLWISSITMILVALIGGILIKSNKIDLPSFGSVARGGEYQRTTATSTSYIEPVIKNTTGVLGSYTVTLLGTASLTLYDATTTDATKRVKATSTLPVLAYFPPSLAAGTYTFDTPFFDGLVAVWGSGLIASSSITWR